MLLGLIQPDAGDIRYRFDGKTGRMPGAAKIGYLPEERGLYQDQPVLNTLTYLGALRGLTRGQAREAGAFWLQQFGLGEKGNQKIQTLSKGNQQLVQFAAAVLHKPDFLILDEPFSGLDPLNQDFVIAMIRQLCDNGMTVLLSAHQMALVERIADFVFLINNGREVSSGTLEQLRCASGLGNRIILHLSNHADVSIFDRLPAVAKVEQTNDLELRLWLRENAPLMDLLKVIGEKLQVTAIRSEQITLHDLFVHNLNQEIDGIR
jgi:ABC-2 type transport system ATP-binding protein